MNSDLLAKIEEQEQCDLPGHISKTKNKHAGAGLSRGLQSAVGGVAAGAAALVAAPVIGAKEGGGKGFAAGLGAGILGAVALPVVGIASGVYEVGVGIANTPAAIQASAEGKVGPSTNSWIFDLKKKSMSLQGRRQAENTSPAARETGQETQTEHSVKDTKLYDILEVQPTPTRRSKKHTKKPQCHLTSSPTMLLKTRVPSISGAYAVCDPQQKLDMEHRREKQRMRWTPVSSSR